MWALLPRQGKPGFEPRSDGSVEAPTAATRPASCGANINDEAGADAGLGPATSRSADSGAHAGEHPQYESSIRK